MTASPELTLGALPLHPAYQSTGGFILEVAADGATFGNPAAIVVAIKSLLQDGSVAQVTGHDNRTAVFNVLITADSYDGLAEGEEALMAEVSKQRNMLTWLPPADDAVATLFDVIVAELDFDFNDLDENRLTRTYTLTLTCEPHARSMDMVTSTAQSSGGSVFEATIDTCDVTTGWTGSPTAAMDGGDFVYVSPGLAGHSSIALTRSGSAIDFSTTPFLVVDYSYTYTDYYEPSSFTVSVNGGAEANPIAVGASPTAGYRRAYFSCSSSSVTSLRFTATGTATSAGLSITTVLRTNQGPGSGTLRQKFQAIDIKGSARAQGSLSISHATSALGSVLVHTSPEDGSGYVPALRPWKSAGSADTADTSLVSGARTTITTAIDFEVPSNKLPQGGYILMARLRSSASADTGIFFSAQSKMGGLVISGAEEIQGRRFTFVANAWTVVTLGAFTLPLNGVAPASSGVTRISIQRDALDAETIDIDEAWLFRVDDKSDLTWVECGTGSPATGGPANRLWIDTPSAAIPLPKIWVGTASDRSDAFEAGVLVGAWGSHSIEPPRMKIFTVTSNALDAAVTLSHYPRWHTHARF